MAENVFQALTYAGNFIDKNRLNQGLYITKVPALHSIDITKEDLIEQAKNLISLTGFDFLTGQYFINLSLCSLTKVELKIIK